MRNPSRHNTLVILPFLDIHLWVTPMLIDVDPVCVCYLLSKLPVPDEEDESGTVAVHRSALLLVLQSVPSVLSYFLDRVRGERGVNTCDGDDCAGAVDATFASPVVLGPAFRFLLVVLSKKLRMQ